MDEWREKCITLSVWRSVWSFLLGTHVTVISCTLASSTRASLRDVLEEREKRTSLGRSVNGHVSTCSWPKMTFHCVMCELWGHEHCSCYISWWVEEKLLWNICILWIQVKFTLRRERERERNCLLSFSAILKVDERNSPTRDTLFSDERRRHVSLRCLFSRIIIVTGEVDCEKASRERLIR